MYIKKEKSPNESNFWSKTNIIWKFVYWNWVDIFFLVQYKLFLFILLCQVFVMLRFVTAFFKHLFISLKNPAILQMMLHWIVCVCVCVWGAQTIALELLRPTLNASFIIKDFNANLLPFQAFLITSFLFAASFSNLTAKLFYDNILWCCRQSLILGLRAHSTCYALAFHLRQFYSVVEPLTLHSSSCIWIACGGGGTGACWHEEQQKRHNYMI